MTDRRAWLRVYLRAMASGRCRRLSELPRDIANVLLGARRAVLTTLDREGRPHAVPVVFAVHEDALVTPIDRKPKTGAPLGRRLNIERDPRVTLLADRWSEDWVELAWVMVRGRASMHPPSEMHAELAAIVARYPQHRATLEGSEVIRIVPERISWWSWS